MALKASTVLPPPAHSKDAHSMKLLSALQRRKQAEYDIQVSRQHLNLFLATLPDTSTCQLLANRIAMLKKEETKALKKIENTKHKAATILRFREEAEKKVVERSLILKQVSVVV
jgi:hypothetical protein